MGTTLSSMLLYVTMLFKQLIHDVCSLRHGSSCGHTVPKGMGSHALSIGNHGFPVNFPPSATGLACSSHVSPYVFDRPGVTICTNLNVCNFVCFAHHKRSRRRTMSSTNCLPLNADLQLDIGMVRISCDGHRLSSEALSLLKSITFHDHPDLHNTGTTSLHWSVFFEIYSLSLPSLPVACRADTWYPFFVRLCHMLQRWLSSKLVHGHRKSHFFFSAESTLVRESRTCQPSSCNAFWTPPPSFSPHKHHAVEPSQITNFLFYFSWLILIDLHLLRLISLLFSQKAQEVRSAEAWLLLQ